MYFVVWCDGITERDKEFKTQQQAENFAIKLQGNETKYQYIDVYEEDKKIRSFYWCEEYKDYILKLSCF